MRYDAAPFRLQRRDHERSEFRLRPAEPADAGRIAELSTQLGYPATPADIVPRLGLIAPDPRHLLLVAEREGCVLGWIHGYVNRVIEADPAVEIGGLVIDQEARGRGIGRRLLEAAERWAREQGCATVNLRSNVIRHGAHAFYQRLGYSIVKTQHAFRKVLPPPDPR